jgi:hypothetical protein
VQPAKARLSPAADGVMFAVSARGDFQPNEGAGR